MSDAPSLTSQFVANPLVSEPKSGGTEVARLLAYDSKVPERLDLGIEFGVANESGIIPVGTVKAHSHYMTADVLDISPEQVGGLTLEQAEKFIADFETGAIAFKANPLTADAV